MTEVRLFPIHFSVLNIILKKEKQRVSKTWGPWDRDLEENGNLAGLLCVNTRVCECVHVPPLVSPDSASRITPGLPTYPSVPSSAPVD